MPRVSNTAPTMTRAMTSHCVKIVLLMLGVKVTRASAGACSPTRVWGAGNSRVPLMKHAGYAQGSVGCSLSNGGART